MAVTATDIKALGSEFEALEDSKIDLFLEIASKEISEPAWPTGSFDSALKLLTAHYLSMAARQGSSGPLTSVKVGDVSVSYGNPQNKEKLSLTSWGQLFLQLRDANICAPLVV